MNVFDLHHDIVPELNLAAQTVTTAVSGAIVDTARYEGLEFTFLNATITADVVALVEHGDDSGLADAETVPADLILGQTANPFSLSTDDAAQSIGYIGKKRYVRITLGGGASNGATSITSIKWGAHHKPAQV